MFKCSFCSYQSDSKLLFVKHNFQAHSTEMNFQYVCGIGSCPRVFERATTFNAFRSHCIRYHHNWKEQIIPFVGISEAAHTEDVTFSTRRNCVSDEEVENMDCDEVGNEISENDYINSSEENTADTHLDVEVAAARFLLNLKEKFKLSQVSLNYTIKAVEEITAISACNIKQSVLRKLHEEGITASSVSLDQCFLPVNPFVNLGTEYQQTKYYKERFNLIVRVNYFITVFLIIMLLHIGICNNFIRYIT